MSYKVIGESAIRWDAISKVQGKAEFTADFKVKNMLHGKICRATITHGFVKSLDLTEALKVPGVIKILTPDDLPETKFPTAGHPYALNPKRRDIADRNILTRHVRLYGDEIAAVIAENELAAKIAVSKIKVEYEELPFYLDPLESMCEGAVEIQEGTNNVVASTLAEYGDIQNGFEESDYVFEDNYKTQIVQHCHMENQVAYAYKDSDQRWVCVSSTQIPHICRRVLGEAFNMPWGKFRVIKPFIGGGFGNKQDITIEPLVVAMSMAVGGRAVILELDREESLAYTRVRHAISYKVKMGVSKDGLIKSLEVDAISNNGAYASHGHAIVAKGAGMLAGLYEIPNLKYSSKTVYTNTAAAGAMRGYGVPQVIFMIESHMEKIAKKLKFDPFEFRLKNLLKRGAANKINKTIQYSNALDNCLLKGKEIFNWDEKAKNSLKYKDGNTRRGVGLANFAYGTGVYPHAIEIGGCRLTLNQDGTIKMIVGATEIGQGSDTTFSQMVAETVGVPIESVYAHAVTDTDYAPYDPGSYASRQSYISGAAVKKAALELKSKILYAVKKFEDLDEENVNIENGNIVLKHTGEIIESLGELALKTYYDIEKAECITADVSNNAHNNSYSTGASFAEVEVDLTTYKVKVLSILNVHDSGIIINPLQASGQVEGGVGMGIGYALLEDLKYDVKTGKPLNNNLLDYKMPTIMDVPDLGADFVEEYDPIGPYGNKALGEPPLCSPAPAIRNALLDAIGVEINELPLSPQKIFESILKNGSRDSVHNNGGEK